MARLDSLCLLITLTMHEGWEVHQIHINSTFLNGDLQEHVYVEQPVGFVIADKEHKVLKLRKEL